MVPIVGITTYVQTSQWGAWTAPAALMPLRMVDPVRLAGGRPLLIPPMGHGNVELVEHLSALVLAGGPDVQPGAYAQRPHPTTDCGEIDRDEGEFDLARAALARGIPTLGICRGAQLLNVLLGGSLHQHIPDMVKHHEHAPEPGVFGLHEVRTQRDSLVAAVLGDAGSVPTHHHQAVDRLGEGLRATAWSPDGVVEAIEMTGDARVLGVQWHPEASDDLRLFKWLVNQARVEIAHV